MERVSQDYEPFHSIFNFTIFDQQKSGPLEPVGGGGLSAPVSPPLPTGLYLSDRIHSKQGSCAPNVSFKLTLPT